MAYRALYRTYRPQVFEDVIGQSHITTILKNQIESGHVAHAYLFCGSRGTGKTSTAKIFARAVNCLTPVQGELCGKCDACLRSISESCPDITEIDAASNNGVDDIRALIESAQYAPLELQKRVFIIDEVHMLSGSAFNALLKTLEEPPAHIMFILATTEPQKLPATIISRCQRFDFHRLSVEDIKRNLRNVLQKAGATIDDGGLSVIARAADGGMRDALSLADQCLSFCGDTVLEKDVYDVLGNMEQDFLFDIGNALLQSDAKKALGMLDGVVRGGRDLTVFCQDLGRHFRALLLAKTCGACENLLDCTEDIMKRYLKQAESVSQSRLLLSLETILKAQGELKYLSSPRALLESVLVRICRPETSLSLESLEARLDQLEQNPGLLLSAAQSKAVTASKKETPVPAAAADFPEEIPLPEPPPGPEDFPGMPAEENPLSELLSDNSNLDMQWSVFLSHLQKEHILAYEMIHDFAPQQLSNGSLLVGYPPDKEAQVKTVSLPGMMQKLEFVLSKVLPDTKIRFVPIEKSSVTEKDEALLKEIFGDKLTIQ